LECPARKNGLTNAVSACLRRTNVQISIDAPHLQSLERESFAGSFDAVAIPQSIRRSMRPADQMRTVLAKKITGATIERNRQVPAQISVRNDGATFVAKQQR